MNDEDKAMVREMIRDEVSDALAIVGYCITQPQAGTNAQEISADWPPVIRQKYLDYSKLAKEKRYQR